MADIDKQVAAATLTTSAPKMGHRKISAALGTFTVGTVIGIDLMIWIWGLVVIAAGTGPDGLMTLPQMPKVVAQQLVALISFLAFYLTKEDQT